MDKMHQTPDVPGTKPITDDPNPGGTQGINPQGPTTGTEGYGLGSGEREAVGGAVSATDPGNISPGAGEGDSVKSFRCADVGNADCRWEAVGRTEDELHPQIERHGREQHGMKEIGKDMWSRIKDAIRERAA
jgi:predicted small metal-binding protein